MRFRGSVCRVIAFALLPSFLLAGACSKKAVEPLPPPKEAAAAPPGVKTPLSPPPAPAEPRADRECAAPIDPGPTSTLSFGSRTAQRSGARLTFAEKDADGVLTFGVLGPMNEDSGPNALALRKYVSFFQEEKVDAIVVPGDIGELAPGIAQTLKELAAAQVPVYVIIGNRECRAEYTNAVASAQAQTPYIVNLNEVRVVEYPELTLVSVPGYHDPKYINCATGCLYLPSTIHEAVRAAKDAKTPVALISHGPPRGQGSQAIDFAGNSENVGDPALAGAIAEAHISFGFHSNIKEAGGRAVSGPTQNELVPEGKSVSTLFLNPGPGDSTVAWDMNDGTKAVGMAAVFRFKDGQGSYKLLRLKPLSPKEKAAAKSLDHPAP